MAKGGGWSEVHGILFDMFQETLKFYLAITIRFQAKVGPQSVQGICVSVISLADMVDRLLI